jgi:hypothetical protein
LYFIINLTFNSMRKVILIASACCIMSIAAKAQRVENSGASANGRTGAHTQGTQISSKGTENPYHMYKGISDPVKAKEAWVADHPHLLNQGHGTVDHTPRAATNNPALGRREDLKQEQTTKPESK